MVVIICGQGTLWVVLLHHEIEQIVCLAKLVWPVPPLSIICNLFGVKVVCLSNYEMACDEQSESKILPASQASLWIYFVYGTLALRISPMWCQRWTSEAVSCKGLYRQGHIDADNTWLIKQTQGRLAARDYWFNTSRGAREQMKSTKALPSFAKDSQGSITLNDRLEDGKEYRDHVQMMYSYSYIGTNTKLDLKHS